MIRKILFLLALASPLAAQTYVKVAVEGDKFAATTPLTYRYGIAAGKTTTGVTCPCWSPSVVTTGAATTTVSNGVIVPTDPAPGLVKELDILQTTVAQTVTVNGKPVVIQALPVIILPPPTVTVPSTSSCTQEMSTGTITCTVTVTPKASA